MALVALTIAGGITVLGWLALVNPGTRHHLGSTSEVLDVVRLGLAVAAGLGGACALGVAYRKQSTNERAHELTLAQDMREAARLFNERFQSAVAQLGDTDSAAVRLGGVYSLASVADDWPAGRQRCVDVLTAYLRLPYDPAQAPPGEREVRHTILTVICEHLHETAPVSWDGLRFDMTGAVLDGGSLRDIHVRSAQLILARTHLVGGTFTLSGEVRGGRIDFTAAVFSDGVLSLPGLYVMDGDVDFSHCLFEGATILIEGGSIYAGRMLFNNCVIRGSQLTVGSTIWATRRRPADEFPLSFDGTTVEDGVLNLGPLSSLRDTERDRRPTAPPAESTSPSRANTVSFHQLAMTGGLLSLREARIESGVLAFGGARLDDGKIDMHLAQLTNTEVNLDGAVLAGTDVDLSCARFTARGGHNGHADGDVARWLVDLAARPVDGRELFVPARPTPSLSLANSRIQAGTLNLSSSHLWGVVVEFLTVEFAGGEISFADVDCEHSAVVLWRPDFDHATPTTFRLCDSHRLVVLHTQHEAAGPIGRIPFPAAVKLIEISPNDR